MGAEDLELIPFASAHFRVLSGWFADERDVVQWGGTGVHFPLDRGQMRAMVAQVRHDPANRFCWMVAAAGELVGHIQVGVDRRNGSALIARVAIAPERRGQGLAAPMIGLVVRRILADAEIERVELNVYAFNTAAIRAYERAGFIIEGVRRSASRVGNERWDSTMMALLRAELQPPAG